MANSASGDSMAHRIVSVLDTFGAGRSVQTVSDISRRAGMPVSTTHRIVASLISEGLLERDDDKRIRLGLRLWELALRGSTVLRLRQAALPFMGRVQNELREHTQLAVLERSEALFIERLSHPTAVSNITRIAGRLPLHASSAGLVLLAHAPDEVQQEVLDGPLEALGPDTITDPARLRDVLADIRQRGWVVAPGSVEAVATGLAVAVREDGRVIAALSAVLPRQADTTAAIATLRRAGLGIERSLASTSPRSA